ncbi:sugar transferase [Turicibacter sanguinis]|uniref:sugar transferase n=1 Tax=Turicibacter sanguinis TaxID=154288 RepID=UPI00189AD699|nr:sugar transferase [Turicibacter sanguinis]
MELASQKFLAKQREEIVRDTRFYLVTKRMMDIVGASIGLILASPIMIMVAILIKLEDPKGPIVFSQERNGVYPKTFRMYKFRSMYVDAEERLQELMHLNEQTGPAFKMKDDPRITCVGKFIRKTSLDELPQLINVLKGEMSIVGPRPAIPREVKLYNDHQKQRLLVKPGITCIWQVSGRNNIGFDDWVELDIEYIKTRNLWLDIKLILMTIPALLGDETAS